MLSVKQNTKNSKYKQNSARKFSNNNTVKSTRFVFMCMYYEVADGVTVPSTGCGTRRTAAT